MVQIQVERYLFGSCKFTKDSKGAVNTTKSDFPPCQSPRPEKSNDPHVEEIKNQGAAKYYRIVCPRTFFGHFDLSYNNGPGENPEEVRSQYLVEVPARISRH